MSVRLNYKATVYLAELNAIDLAVDHVLEHNYARVDIITDSRSVLQALSNPTHNCPLIWRLKCKLKNATTNISRKWTKAHIGTLGNDGRGAWSLGRVFCLSGRGCCCDTLHQSSGGASNHLLNYPTQEPVEKEVNSQTTKKAVQSAIDVPAMNIAIKNVRNINNGGILIETDSGKLINEFKAKDALKTSYNIARTVARKPHIICFEVSPDTGETQLVEGLRKQFIHRDMPGRRFHRQAPPPD
ncbi:hypothetical protein CDAR_459031 [Caerostris darwini]|uniref:RNase H type-1 domain-containing protein n=1 Tax=Caerostris darwini TaxID=1538125 RepID=A0AAV4SW11_9ARAC|nr:hypothetical protein CDAR_459031 [Caerostris darwini]